LSGVDLHVHRFASTPESVSETYFIVVSKTRSVVNFLEKVSSSVKLSMDLFSFTSKSPSTFFTSLEVINLLETLSLVNVGKELTLVVSVMLNHQLSNSRGTIVVLLSFSEFIEFIDFIE
jgi:hypothetical protein